MLYVNFVMKLGFAVLVFHNFKLNEYNIYF